MSQEIQIILNQVGIFAILMGMGYTFIKTKLIGKEALKGISSLLMKVLMPITAFYVIYDSGATIELFMENGMFFLLTAIVFIVLMLIGTLLSKVLKMKYTEAVPFILYFVFNNNNFFGLPLITNLFDSASSRVNFSQHLIIDNVFLWTVGIYLCTKHLSGGNFLKQARRSINEMTIAIVLAFIMMAFNVQLPSIINDALIGFKSGSGSIAMFYVGCLLATTDFKDIFKDKSFYVLVVVKMVIAPVLILILCRPLLGMESALIMAIMMGLPGKIMVSIMVGSYELNDRYAAKMVFGTTLVALVTIPLITWVSTLI